MAGKEKESSLIFKENYLKKRAEGMEPVEIMAHYGVKECTGYRQLMKLADKEGLDYNSLLAHPKSHYERTKEAKPKARMKVEEEKLRKAIESISKIKDAVDDKMKQMYKEEEK